MMRIAPFRVLVQLAAVWLAASLAACGGQKTTPEAPTPAAALEVLTIAPGGPAGGILWDGVVQAVEQSVLSAQTSGRVTSLLADVDQHVARGAPLLRLTATEQKSAVDTAEAQVRAAEAQLADAAARFRRASELVGQQLISADEFDRVRAAHDSALANRDLAQAQRSQARQQLDYTAVSAPYAGVIAARHVELGETVAPGQALFTLYSPGQLRLEVQVPQADAASIRDRPEAQVLLGGATVQATRVTVFPGADPLAHSTTVRVVLPALQPPPRPGQTAKVRFAAAAGPEGLWLPDTAVVQRGELTAAYVVRADGIVLRQLRIGRNVGGRLEVLAGLTPGEQVARSPAAALAALQAQRLQANARHE